MKTPAASRKASGAGQAARSGGTAGGEETGELHQADSGDPDRKYRNHGGAGDGQCTEQRGARNDPGNVACDVHGRRERGKCGPEPDHEIKKRPGHKGGADPEQEIGREPRTGGPGKGNGAGEEYRAEQEARRLIKVS